jgi:Mycothiol maleylpyruvate isomerase N-terminal domain
VTTSDTADVLDILAASYRNVSSVADDLTEATALRPSRCAGWSVADVLYHQLLDARRALRTFATPSAAPPDVDAVSYWLPFSAGSGDPAEPFSLGAARHARHVRIASAAYSPVELAWEWGETSAAALRAARACTHAAVATQGHTLLTGDFVSTLAVEACVHYLDITPGQPAPPSAASGLALARSVLTGLAGASPGTVWPADWTDEKCVLIGTGRSVPNESDTAALGSVAGRLPLLG